MDSVQTVSMTKQRLSLSIESDILDKLNVLAKKEMRTLSNLVEFMLAKELERMENDQQKKPPE